MNITVTSIKEWKMITKAERLNLDIMRRHLASYEVFYKNDYSVKPDYIKISNCITDLLVSANKELAKLEKETEMDNKLAAEAKQVSFRINDSLLSIDEIIDNFNVWQVGNGNLCWYLQEIYTSEYGERQWTCLKKDTLLARFTALDIYIPGGKGVPDYNSFKEFTKRMAEKNRIFTKIIQSWTKKTGNGTLNILHNNFCKPSVDKTTDYHWFMDAVLESVSGGVGADKKDHMEQIFLAKYQHPENIFLPNIFCNDGGATGKGLITDQFATRLFGGAVAMNCSMEHLTGKFNGSIAGKALISINETTREKVDQDKLKAFLGSTVFKVEEKYERVVDADNCGLVFSSANGTGGSVSLSGAGSDRRYSIFSSKTTIYLTVQRYFSAKENKKITLEQAKTWVETTGAGILHDETQVGKWITAMTCKYGDIKNLAAVKGEAYDTLLNRQRGAWLDTVESIITDPGFTYIREGLLRDLVREYNRGEIVPGKKTFNEGVEKLCADKGYAVVMVERVSIKDSVDIIGAKSKSIQRTVWKKDDKKNTVFENESAYGEADSRTGKWIWKWIS